MPNRKLAPSRYRELISDIVRIYDGARHSLVLAHWEIGKRVVKIEQDGASRAAYGAGLLSRVSRDLSRERGPGFSETNLRRFRRFYLARKQPRVAELGWSQHNELLAVRDPKKRRLLEERAVREGLKRDDLRDLIRESHEKLRNPTPRTIDVTPLVPRRGPLHTYEIVTAEDVGWPAGRDGGRLLMDHGFRLYSRLTSAQSRRLKSGDIVEARGDKVLKSREAKPGYTYRAYLRSIWDGDTYWIVLDADHDNILRQKLRLRGIDCPEIATPEGKAAKKFVADLLRDVPFLTVHSTQNDKYGRFEVDVFLPARSLKASAGGTGTPGDQCLTDLAGKEVFLNNLLLETGHAVPMPNN